MPFVVFRAFEDGSKNEGHASNLAQKKRRWGGMVSVKHPQLIGKEGRVTVYKFEIEYAILCLEKR